MSDKFYCMYCGDCRTSISSLTNGHCNKNPEGQYCVLYEGREKDSYSCKYCGDNRSSISSLTNSHCSKSPIKYCVPSIN